MAARPDDRLTKTGNSANGGRDQRLARTVCRFRGETRTDLAPQALIEALRNPEGVLWVDIDAAERHQHALLEKVFNFHPLAIEDTLNPDSRVKIEEYNGYLFAIIRGVEFDESTEDPYDLDTLNLCFFLGPNYLVTVHKRPSAACSEMNERMARSPDLLDRGAARLMHALMDSAIDEYFPIIDRVDEFIENLEERILATQNDRELRTVFAVKRLVLSLRRHLAPQREVFGILATRPNSLLPVEVQLYFRDIYDHVLRLNESFEVQRDMLTSTMEAYLSQVSNRLGQVTKGLAVVATLSIPFVVVSGMWGMNFERIPLSGWNDGFWLMLVVQLGLGCLLILLLRWQKWL